MDKILGANQPAVISQTLRIPVGVIRTFGDLPLYMVYTYNVFIAVDELLFFIRNALFVKFEYMSIIKLP